MRSLLGIFYPEETFSATVASENVILHIPVTCMDIDTEANIVSMRLTNSTMDGYTGGYILTDIVVTNPSETLTEAVTLRYGSPESSSIVQDMQYWRGEQTLGEYLAEKDVPFAAEILSITEDKVQENPLLWVALQRFGNDEAFMTQMTFHGTGVYCLYCVNGQS